MKGWRSSKVRRGRTNRNESGCRYHKGVGKRGDTAGSVVSGYNSDAFPHCVISSNEAPIERKNLENLSRRIGNNVNRTDASRISPIARTRSEGERSCFNVETPSVARVVDVDSLSALLPDLRHNDTTVGVYPKRRWSGISFWTWIAFLSGWPRRSDRSLATGITLRARRTHFTRL